MRTFNLFACSRWGVAGWGAAVLLLPLSLWANAAPVGTRWETLTVGEVTYHQVELRAISARTVTIRHAGGLSALRWKDLPEDLQQTLGYDAEAEAEAERASAAEQTVSRAKLNQVRQARLRQFALAKAGGFEVLLQQLGQEPDWRPQVDLRALAPDLAGPKDQGRRPSCSVFAVVSALELQNAVLTGHSEKLSEEYLIWATRQVTRRVTPARAESVEADPPEATEDEGFSLAEVVSAVRAYGVPLQTEMPNTFGRAMGAIPAPAVAVIDEARARRRVFVHVLPAPDRETAIANVVHALNAGVPVVLAVRWPHERTIRSGLLSEQLPIPGYAHAVAVIGYTAAGGRGEDAVFLFRNSYGVRWGQGGYGRMTSRYLREHFLGAILLEVQRGQGS